MMSKERKEILEKLEDALRESCLDALRFSDDETHLISAEYLLTVNAAKAIQKLNICFGTPYKIYLEHSTENFSTNCTPRIGKKPADNFLGHKSCIRRKKNDAKRKGKIDIAVYKSGGWNDIPVCAIEIKGFDPIKPDIIADLVRNSEYFTMDSETGKSEISFTAFVALHSYTNTMSDEKEKKNINKKQKLYEGYLEKVKLPIGVKSDINIFTVRRGIVPDPQDPQVQRYGLNGDEDYHFMGAIICFIRKK